jgi:predicted DNA-binding protein
LNSSETLAYDAGVSSPRKPQAPQRRPTSRQVNFRLPFDTWQRLDAISDVLGFTQSQVITEAIATYLDAMAPAKRKIIEDVLALRKKV